MSSSLPAPVSLVVDGLAVRFTWQIDRWAHSIAWGDDAWRSVEGPHEAAGDPRWPASPVLVELSRLDLPHGPAILGVGRAGKSHFSASITADPGRPGRLVFEIACRVQDPPAWLGSTYRGPAGRVCVVPPAGPEPPATIRWAYAVSPRGIEPLGEARRTEAPAD